MYILLHDGKQIRDVPPKAELSSPISSFAFATAVTAAGQSMADVFAFDHADPHDKLES
jgi:hypothetical protein